MEFISGVFKESYKLFIEMTPYILFGVIIAGILSVYVNKKYVAKHIGGHTFNSIFKAALFGVPLPLCSCGVVPTTVYLKQSGASKPAAMSFLIATPQTGVDSIIATYGMLGPFFAVFRPLAALLTGMWGGLLSLIFDKSEDKKHKTFEVEEIRESISPGEKLRKFKNYAFIEFVDDIAVQFIIGLILAGLISYIIPDNFFEGSFLADGFAGMIFMIIIGIPLYICSTSSIPIAVALIAKGISPGAAYVFLIAGPATNAASLAILLKVLGKKQTFIYLISIITGSIIAGFIINLFYNYTELLSFIPGTMAHTGHTSVFKQFLSYSAAVFFFLLIFMSLRRKFMYKFTKPKGENSPDCGCSGELCVSEKANEVIDKKYEILKVSGMSCHHCASNVENALQNIKGVVSAKVNLEENNVRIDGDFSIDDAASAVEAVGYKLE